MANICKTEAIVLKGMRYKESSRIVSLYTKKFGRVTVVARGIRRPKSRFGSSLEPLTVSNIVFYRKERKGLYSISEADIVRDHAGIRNDLERMSTAYVIVDFLDAANPEETPNLRLFALADSMLDSVEELPSGSLDVILWTFLIRAAEMLGYAPVFDHCVKCKKRKEKMGFNPSLGGAVCPECTLGEGDVWRIRRDSLDLMSRLARGAQEEIWREKSSPEQAREISEVLRAHLLYHTERNLRSFDFRKSLEASKDSCLKPWKQL